MKMVGFRREYDKDLLNSKFIYGKDDVRIDDLTKDEKNKLISYLESAKIIFSMTWALNDEQGPIGPYMICSDGEWVWPGYYSHFIKKEGMINRVFLYYLKEKKYTLSAVSDDLIKNVALLFGNEIKTYRL